MLIGHYAPALALHRIRPSVKLWQLFVATQFVDILWAFLVLAGIEHVRVVPGFTDSNDLDLWHMPYTHSLAAALVWSALTFAVWRSLQRAPGRTGDAVVLAVAVASHFVADLLMHVRDLPVMAAQGTKLGFGLWRHRPLALVVETGLFAMAAGWWWWPHRAHPGARAAAAVLLSLTLVAAASFYIPTPPTPSAMALTSLATCAATAALAHWMERTCAPARSDEDQREKLAPG